MSKAILGFSNGPSIEFRLNPQQIDWKFSIITSVTETLGGRVIQVVGSDLSDLVITGQFGEVRGNGVHIESWKLAESFFTKIREMMQFQARNAQDFGRMGPSAVFTYEPLGIRFNVYIKEIQDPDGGGAVTHRPGKFSYEYRLVLFIVQPKSANLIAAGEDSSGVVDDARKKAIEDYMSRVSDGVGWKYSETWNGAYGTATASTESVERAPGGSEYESQVSEADEATNIAGASGAASGSARR